MQESKGQPFCFLFELGFIEITKNAVEMHHVGRIFTPIIAFQYDFYIYNYYENANKNLLLFYKTSINHIIVLIPHNE